MAKDLLYRWHARQNVIAGIALFGHDVGNLLAQRGVKVCREVGLENQIAMRNKLAHLFIG
jgi:hypothetical protein